MSSSDPILDFAAQHLGGRTMPNDLRRLLELQARDAASGSASVLKDAGVTFLDGDRLPGLVEAECRGRDDLGGIARLAHAQAMADMVRESGFVAEDEDSGAIGYWFGPEQLPIESAPLMRFDRIGSFSVVPGNGIAEAILVIGSHGNDETFAALRDALNRQGFAIAVRSIGDIGPRKCAVGPQATYEQLIQSYSANLSTESAPDSAGPIEIMTTHRGPEIT
jgi:hypothetical protein